MNSLSRTYDFIVNHPLAGQHRMLALRNWLLWQVSCRVRKPPIEVPYVGKTRLAVSPGMHGATGNIYCGLHEFNDMAFLLHFLTPSDRFADVGANIGSYTVLASGVCGASTIAIEPVSTTASSLQTNVELNDLSKRVTIERSALGDVPGEVNISTALDCTNHVQRSGETGDFEIVPLKTLDDLLNGQPANLIKIDVEGFEMQVLRGAQKSLANDSLMAIIMEMNGSGRQYGVSDDELRSELEKFDFYPFSYHPFNRNIGAADEVEDKGGNQIFLRDVERVGARLKQAKPFRVLGQSI